MPNDQIVRILVVDDHHTVVKGTATFLQHYYADAQIDTASTVAETLAACQISQPNLLVLDLSLPEMPETEARPENGIALLKQLMEQYPELNIAIQSTYVKTLVRVLHEIDAHQGGFTTFDKGLPEPEVLKRVNSALDGFSYTREIKGKHPSIQLKPTWLKVLRLAFEDGLQDRAIAKELSVQESTVRHYWKKIYDILEIDPTDERQDGKNLRIRTQICSRERGLID